MSDPRLIRNAMRTPDGSYLESRSRHDYVGYKDANGKTYTTDGGLEYAHRTVHGDEIDMCLHDDQPHAVQREVLQWGSYGKDGKQPLKLIPISCMDTSHLEAILEGNHPSPVYANCMQIELSLRLLGEL